MSLQQWAASVRAMPAEDFWIWTAIAAAGGLICFWLWFRSLKRARLIEDTPTSKCRSAAQGYVELVGRQLMMPGEPIRAPLTGKPCTWWSFSIEEKRTSRTGKHTTTRWVSIESETSGELFLVRDDTGDAIVDPDGAEVISEASDVWYGSSVRPTAPPSGGMQFFGGRYRYTEKRMHEKDNLYAIGLFQSQSKAISTTEKAQQVAALLAQWKRDQHGLFARFDQNKDGQIDLQEWETARVAAEQDVEAHMKHAALAPDIHIMRQPRDGRPYILSVLPPEKLTRRFRLIAAISLVACLSLATSAFFLVTSRFGG